MDEVKQYALQRRALLLEIKQVKREIQIAEDQLGMARTNSWVNATKLIALLSTLKTRFVMTQERLAAFDKDLGND